MKKIGKKIKEMAVPTVCRVCLVSDRTMYRIVNTKLQEIYEQVAKAKLQRVNWPVTLCCICVSQLCRCQKFIEAAQEANEALDQWWSKSKTEDLNLTEKPLLSFSKTSPEITEFTANGIQEVEVKQELEIDETKDEDNEINTTDNESNFNTQNIKYELISPCNDPENNNICVPNELNDNTDLADHNELEKDDDNKTASDTSNAGYNESNCGSDDDYVPKQARRSTKRAKLSRNTKGSPALKKQRQNKPQHGSVKTGGATKVKTKMFYCGECNYKSAHRKNYNLHLKKHTDEQPLLCDKCDYKTFNKDLWKKHLFTHTGEKPFACNECDYRSATKGDLKRHSLRHIDEKPFHCEQCDYKCKQKECLKQHQKIHTGEKPFACNLCDYKSNQKSKLNMHLKRHTGEEPYLCDQCFYKTVSRSDLRRHLMRHAGQKPFACHLCDFKCLLKYDLNKHLMAHSGIKRFMCSQCDYKCTQNRLLKLHFKKHVGIKPFESD